MKHVYLFKKAAFPFFFTLVLIALVSAANAQNQTFVLQGNNCEVVENFNDNDGAFSSPSIFSGDDDVAYYWNDGLNAWLESSGLIVRDGSLISGIYNHTEDGAATIGFDYNVPPGTFYRIRMIAFDASNPLGTSIVAQTNNGPEWDLLPSTSGTLCLRLLDADIQSPSMVRYEISFRSVAAGDILFDEFALGAQASPLPVTFLGFTARKENGNVRLLWDVADEVNVRGYEIERSSDGINFQNIGFIPANAKSVYSFVDLQSKPGTNFYRVRNVDYDMQFKYTNIVKITNNRQGSVKLYPVPATTQVFLQHDKAVNGSVITISSTDGRLVKRINPTPNSIETSIDVSALKAGLYFVKFDDGAGNVESMKLVKK